MDNFISLIIAVAFYCFTSFCLMTIATRLNVPNPWLSWIPFANIWVVVMCAGKPWWWILLLLIPLVNIVIAFILMFSIPPRLGKSGLLGLLLLLPILGPIIYFSLLTFT